MSCFGAIQVKYSSAQASSIPASGNYPKVGMAIKNSYSRERRCLSTINPRFELRMERNIPGIDEGCMPEPAASASSPWTPAPSVQASPVAFLRMVIKHGHRFPVRQDLRREDHTDLLFVFLFLFSFLLFLFFFCFAVPIVWGVPSSTNGQFQGSTRELRPGNIPKGVAGRRGPP